MGSSQSVPSTYEITDSLSHVSNVKEYTASTKNGPKAQTMEQTNLISVIAEEDSDSSVMSAESDYSSDEDDDFEFDSNEDEEAAERRMILEEARQLKEMAGFYLHPEAPVASNAMASARCYFTRYSAPVASEDEVEDESERKLILADAENLKELAGFYMHPEKPVASNDANACGRNYFARPSAPSYDDEDEDMEERERILEETKQLKTTAEWYLNLEKPVAVDATACGRNFFTRPSAPLNEEEKEREHILEEMRQLKTTAEWYLKPEMPIAVDATASGRNFFTRPCAPVSEDEEEHELILEEMKELKTAAEWYMHPEKPVAVDSTACGRNFYTRPSAPEYEGDVEDIAVERELVLADMKALKTVAEWYMHPEKPVSVDPIVCGRNYFTRPSAPVNEEDAERELILEEINKLKTTAEWYLRPEKPVAVDTTACGRNYFSRPSAPMSDVDTEEQERILEDLKQLKMTAEWYMHPEKPVAADPSCFGRNYFTRPSAPNGEDDVEEERGSIMEDLKQLKMTAEWYMHPEKPVAVDATACGRNYFTRSSAPAYKDDVEEERDSIMQDVKLLKMTAEWYMNPEKPVSVDSTVRGRNYFSRPSAMGDDAGALSWETSSGKHLSLDFESNYTDEVEEERRRVLAEASQLKEVASWYLQPESPVKVDPTAFGRNYFSRPSATEKEDEHDERELILADLSELKRVADWYMHPEKKVTVYATACGRNYFARPSAPEYEDEEDVEEHEKILSDTTELLRVAEWYMHPEEPVTVYATACGRNFFSRPSAPEDDSKEDLEEERQRILAETRDLKEVAGWYLKPEQPVKSDGFATARNYFTRPSAPEYDNEEREQTLADAKELKKVAEWYLNPEKPVKSDCFATARNYFTRPSAPAYEEGQDEEREQVLSEAKQLKEVASWYLEPEKPVTVVPTAYGRNYFSRPSAEESSETPEEEERGRILANAMELKKLGIDYLHPEKPVASSSIHCARNYFDRPSAQGHLEQIHTQGHSNDTTIHGDYVHEGYDYHHQHHHHYDDYHHDDISHQSFQSQSDHFEMDEDVFHGFRESINAFHESVVGVRDHEHIPMIKEEDGKEGNLSRSPSSIMLFDEQAAI
eukprot:CAMPEP_0172356012 /NCGR_PEP_ID=MMETSP1060-20121228/350_1 /TAXON_ID=37318 /ORGANISM="Pseudo-nitzschia pungens, Strain cf. cingulata" /LENGTH=1099 /DNA_ID=CAMNT_0013075891 /DNA_START=70 /DNA_END=3369 /DNA_ORIENTATION=-